MPGSARRGANMGGRRAWDKVGRGEAPGWGHPLGWLPERWRGPDRVCRGSGQIARVGAAPAWCRERRRRGARARCAGRRRRGAWLRCAARCLARWLARWLGAVAGRRLAVVRRAASARRTSIVVVRVSRALEACCFRGGELPTQSGGREGDGLLPRGTQRTSNVSLTRATTSAVCRGDAALRGGADRDAWTCTRRGSAGQWRAAAPLTGASRELTMLASRLACGLRPGHDAADGASSAGSSEQRSRQLHEQRFGRVDELMPGDPNHAIAGGGHRELAPPVGRDAAARRMEGLAVDLDDQL